MQKLIIKNKYQSPNRMNILTAAGIAQINEPITPQNGERIFGGLGVVTFNQASQYNEEENPNDPITPPNCPDCPPIDPPTDPDDPTPPTPQGCTCRSLDELGDYIEQKASESFCENTPVEDDNQYFPCLTGADGGELRISCPKDDDCSDEDLCENPDNLPVNPVTLNNRPALYAVKFVVLLSCDEGGDDYQILDEYSFYDVFKVMPNTTTDKYDAGGYYWYYNFYPDTLVSTVQGWYDELVGCSSSSCVCCTDQLPIPGVKWGNGSGGGQVSGSIHLFGVSCCKDLSRCSRDRTWRIGAIKVDLSEACENLRKKNK